MEQVINSNEPSEGNVYYMLTHLTKLVETMKTELENRFQVLMTESIAGGYSPLTNPSPVAQAELEAIREMKAKLERHKEQIAWMQSAMLSDYMATQATPYAITVPKMPMATLTVTPSE